MFVLRRHQACNPNKCVRLQKPSKFFRPTMITARTRPPPAASRAVESKDCCRPLRRGGGRQPSFGSSCIISENLARCHRL